jgi:hypothetical protein
VLARVVHISNISGEYMVLIESGFTIRRALLFNFISACTAMAGFFIGASIAENEGARTWIFVITAGTFTYIALVDLVRNCSIFVYVDFIVCVYIHRLCCYL